MSGFSSIIGQELAKKILKKAVRENRPAHAYLFLGLQSTGKLTTALAFTKALSCEKPLDGDACGECAICRSFEHGNFPDVRVYSPDGQNTRIEQMRDVRDLANFRPVVGKWKVNIVEQGDTLNEDSANCILKLLEEPPDYLINVLLLRNAANVLSTIRSRCQLVRFTQVDAAELAARLVMQYGAGEEEAEFLAAYSQGCPGRAISLVGNDEFFARRDEIVEVASDAVSRGPFGALKLAERLRETSDSKSARESLLETLDMLALWYRDLLDARLRGDQVLPVNLDKVDEIRRQSALYRDAGFLSRAIDAILSARRAILGNGNPQIVTESLMVRLTSA